MAYSVSSLGGRFGEPINFGKDAKLASDLTGGSIAVWIRPRIVGAVPLRGDVEAAFRPSGGAFRDTERVSELDDGAALDVDVAVDTSGWTLMAWTEQGKGVKLVARPPGGPFERPTVLRPVTRSDPRHDRFRGIDVAAGPDGTVAVSWIAPGGRVETSIRPTGGDFGAPVILPSGSGPRGLQVEVTPTGEVVYLWSPTSDSESGLEALVRGSNGRFAAREVLSPPEPPIYSPTAADMAVDLGGNTVVVWRRCLPVDVQGCSSREVWSAYRPTAGAFGSRRRLSPRRRQGGWDPQVAVDSRGNGLAVWGTAEGTYSAAYYAGGPRDDVAPLIRKPAIGRARPRPVLTYGLSEPANITALIERRGRYGKYRTSRVRRLAGILGRNRDRLPDVRPGRYRLTLDAVDGAGNRSGLTRLTFVSRPERR